MRSVLPDHHCLLSLHCYKWTTGEAWTYFLLKERTPLQCSPTPTFTLLRYVSTAGSQLFTQEFCSAACLGLSSPALSSFPLSPKMHGDSNTETRVANFHTTHRFLKLYCEFAQQRLAAPLPCAYYNLPLVQPELGTCVWVCVSFRSAGLPLKQLLKESWIPQGVKGHSCLRTVGQSQKWIACLILPCPPPEKLLRFHCFWSQVEMKCDLMKGLKRFANVVFCFRV